MLSIKNGVIPDVEISGSGRRGHHIGQDAALLSGSEFEIKAITRGFLPFLVGGSSVSKDRWPA
jgi:hypothetical protein